MDEASPHMHFDYIPVGTYMMLEDITPAGYVTAEDIKITVTETGEVQTYEAMVDKPISLEISKISVAGSKEVEGAELEIYKAVPDENGNPVKKIKRHPNIGNDVVIYANATILGGDTTVGDHSIIGGNTWLTHSVPAGTTVSYTAAENKE